VNGFGWVKAVRLVEGYEVGSMGRWWEGGKGGGGGGQVGWKIGG